MPGIELAGATLTAIDFETTGSVPGWPNEPWQVGLYRFTLSQPLDAMPVLSGRRSPLNNASAEVRGREAPAFFSSPLRIAPDRPFNRFAPGRHALLRHELAVAPTLPELWEEISPWLVDTPLVAHNIGTERTLLRAAAPLHRLGPWIDTLALARALLPGRASYALEDLVSSLGLTPRVAALASGLAPHDALYDAIACGELLCALFALGLSFCPCA